MGDQELTLMFWNVENFFDWRNDSTTVSDQEFSAAGERHWTWKRFQAKANAFAKALLWVEGETGRLPDVVGLAEVENAFVLRQVLQKTALRKLDYRYVHYDSPDRRGIDVALLYRSSRLELLDSKPCHLYAADSLLATRDILLCVFRRIVPVPPSVFPGASSVISDTHSAVPGTPSVIRGTPTAVPGTPTVIPGLTGNLPEGRDGVFAVLVNHHPSKYGGASESEPRRRIAVERLRFLADSLSAAGIDRIIACGDFNDTPANPVFHLLEPTLRPLHLDLYRRGFGTIKYDGKWDLIDHIYVSPALAAASMSSLSERSSPGNVERQRNKVGEGPSAQTRMQILRIPFLLTRDTVHSGEKPLRTYTGPRHTGGVSDHLPILLEVPFPP
ncbi:MAG: endonuclease/exonuclease/phosphatase family protein [Bacteroidales bacterium]|nr:endonuclease/exonuclease/phosphatase family protein [Bacteroidales bacterium]